MENSASIERRVNLGGDSHRYPLRVGYLDCVRCRPALPRARQRVPSFESKPTVAREGRVNRSQRLSDFIVLDEHLKGMTRHDNQVELILPGDRTEITENPLNIPPLICLQQHASRWI